MWCQWLDFSSFASTLGFWRRWLVVSLQNSPRSAWPGILERFYRTGDPLAVALAICLLLGVLCLALSIPTNNHSWVDKLWSIAPVYYAWHFALHDKLLNPGVPLNPRLLIISAIVTVWGTRLTYNFARKGGYRHDAEDYRWPYLRARIHPLLFFVFNATFVAFIQHLVLLGLTTPAYLAWQNAGTALNEVDLAAAALCAFFIGFEAVADQQQWAFQTAKHAKLAARKRLTAEQAQGFLSSGLFRYSRHPNFWAEQSLWWSLYLFGVAASGRWVNWTIVAPISLSAIFQGSTWLTEKISVSKYPKYRTYQRTTSCFFPLPPASDPSPARERAGAAAEDGARTPRTPGTAPRTGRKTRAAATPGTATEDEPEPAAAAQRREEQAAAATPATRQRRGRGRAVARPAAAEQPQEVAEAEPVASKRRPARSPKKTARVLAVEEAAPAPTRMSTRLRSRAGAA